ncbi:MAG: hypothetical protein WBD22_09735 [Pyrinomonadaceae bacterium]
MDDLDVVWEKMLEDGIARARAGGRDSAAEYLTLKAGNDQIRRTSVRWLLDSMIELASGHAGSVPAIKIEKEEPHNFSIYGANMVGSLLRFRQGVRCLTLEAGWTRTPKDGFMRGGALAFARLIHFGMPKANEELALVRSADTPHWLVNNGGAVGAEFGTSGLLRHFHTFTDD